MAAMGDRSTTLILLNPAAGGGRALRAVEAASATIRDLGMSSSIRRSEHPGDLERYAREAANNGDRVIAIGGDGTIQEVANGLLSVAHPPPMGVIPAGRGNDFARTLGIPVQVDQATRLAVSGETRSVDVGVCNGRYYLCAGGVGFDGEVAYRVSKARRRWQRSRAAYLAGTLLELRRYRNRDVRITLDGEVIERRVLLVAVANGPFYGGGMLICPDAELTDGLLDVCIVGDISRAEALKELPGIYRGRHVRNPAVEIHRSRTVRIEAGPGARSHLDGELGTAPPLEFRAVAQALRVVTPG